MFPNISLPTENYAPTSIIRSYDQVCHSSHHDHTHSRLCWQWGTEARIKSVRLELSLEGWEAASSLYFTVTSYKIGRQGGECEPSRSVCA